MGAMGSSLGQLTAGGGADVCVFDPQAQWQVSNDALKSQGKHTPFAYDMGGMMLQGRVRCTIVSGHVAYEA
jgi:dihydroorotase